MIYKVISLVWIRDDEHQTRAAEREEGNNKELKAVALSN